jgi:hypothetical protein
LFGARQTATVYPSTDFMDYADEELLVPRGLKNLRIIITNTPTKNAREA